jgi:integrase/recombinase XerD
MSQVRQAVDDYLSIRRGQGFKLRGHDRLLKDFLDYLDTAGTPVLSTEVALAWATSNPDVQQTRHQQRLTVVRGFAAYLHVMDASVPVPPANLLACRRRRRVPYLYSPGEILALVNAAGSLRPVLRGHTYRTLFALLATTGMRVGEGIGLDRGDVDLERGLLLIRQAKFNKSRQLPLHASSVAALRQYADQRDRICPSPKTASFFVSTVGTRVLYHSANTAFAVMLTRTGLQARSGSGRPRIHDLRHSFAVATLRGWYQAGDDVAAKAPLLSAYLGHVSPVSTYWYLQADPELLALAAARLECGRQWR